MQQFPRHQKGDIMKGYIRSQIYFSQSTKRVKFIYLFSKDGAPKRENLSKMVLPGGYAFHKFSQNVTSFHKFSQHENRYKIVKAGEKW